MPENIQIDDAYKNKIVFIPDRNESKEKLETIHKILKDKYGNELIVVGDMKTYLEQHNVILRYPDYVENGYKYILSSIIQAKMVLCPISHWSIICNIQGVPLFTWGKQVGPYKEQGTYNFNNKCMAIPTDKYTAVDAITKMFNYFKEEKTNGPIRFPL